MGVATPGVRRISLEEYEAMARDGRLDPGVAVELLDGVVVPKMTKGLRHLAITRRLQTLFREALPAGWVCLKEDPVHLPLEGPEGGGTLPEPDVTVLRGGAEDYEARYPEPDDIALVVEVASNATMLKRDRDGLARYARNGVRVVWVVNLPADVVEVYTLPTGPGNEPVFEGVAVAKPGEAVTLDLGDGDVVRLDAGEILA
jgi:Uma2 family endonuclease